MLAVAATSQNAGRAVTCGIYPRACPLDVHMPDLALHLLYEVEVMGASPNVDLASSLIGRRPVEGRPLAVRCPRTDVLPIRHDARNESHPPLNCWPPAISTGGEVVGCACAGGDASRFVPPAGAAATMTIVPSVRPTHLLPPRWSPLVDRTLNVTVEPGGMGPIVANGRRTRSGNGHGAIRRSVQARRSSSPLLIAWGPECRTRY